MNRSLKTIAVVVFAFAVSAGRGDSVVEAACGNQAAAEPTNHADSSGVPTGGGCTNCFTFVDTYSSRDSCVGSEGNNCVWTPNAVVVTRQEYECVNSGGIPQCTPHGDPYELPTLHGQYVTHACHLIPQF